MHGLLDSIPNAAPALEQALHISQAAVDVGFEWDSVDEVWEKVDEEVAEFKEALPGSAHQVEEFGDVLFTLVNVARKEGIDPEAALMRACDKFRRRWSVMERLAHDELGCSIEDVTRGQLEDLWCAAKRELSA